VLKLKSPIMKYSLTILMGLLAPILLLAQNGTSEDPLSIYNEFCSNCHGMNFEGGNAQSLVDGVWQFGAGRSYMFRNIKYGIQHLGMPSYEATLSDKQINSLVAFLLEEEKKAGASKPPTPDMIETQDYKIKITVVADSLEIPWSIDFIGKHAAYRSKE
jgi:cytochrome c553